MPSYRKTFSYDPGLPEGTGPSRRQEEGRRREGGRERGGRRRGQDQEQEQGQPGEAQEQWNWKSSGEKEADGEEGGRRSGERCRHQHRSKSREVCPLLGGYSRLVSKLCPLTSHINSPKGQQQGSVAEMQNIFIY